MLMSFASYAIELTATEKSNIIKEITKSVDEILYHNEGSGETVHCKIEKAKDSLQEASFLWEDLSKINEQLVNKTFNNFDKFLSFVKYLDGNNDPSFLGSSLYILNAFAQLAVDNDKETTTIDSETMLALLDIIQNDPFNMPMEKGLLDLIKQMDHLEISKIQSSGTGEIKVIIHNKGDKEIIASMAEIVGYEIPVVKDLKIKNGSSIIFIDGQDQVGDKIVHNEAAIATKNAKIDKILSKINSKSNKKIAKNIKKNIKTKFNQLENNIDNSPEKMNNYMQKVFLSYFSIGKSARSLQANYVDLVTEMNNLSKDTAAVHVARYINEQDPNLRKTIAAQTFATNPNQGVILKKLEELRANTIASITAETTRRQSVDFNANDIAKAKAFVKSQEKITESPPLYFEVDGIRASVMLGITGAVKSGVLLPGLRLNGKDSNSLFIKAQDTTFGGIKKMYLPL